MSIINKAGLIFSSIVCIAIPYSLEAQPIFTGLYAGVNTGLAATVDHMSYYEPSDENSPILFTGGQVHFSGGGNVGYSFSWKQYRIAPEIFALYSPSSIDSVGTHTGMNEYFNHVQNNFAWGGGIKFAKLISDKTIMGIEIGLANSQFHFQNTNKPKNPLNAYNKNKWAWSIAATSETMLTTHISLTLKANYTDYGSIKHLQNTVTTTLKPKTISAQIGLNYYLSTSLNT